MGDCVNQLDDTTLSAMTWAYSTRFFEPDDIVNENSANFKEGTFDSVFASSGKHDSDDDATEDVANLAHCQPRHIWSRPNEGHEEDVYRSYTRFSIRLSPSDC